MTHKLKKCKNIIAIDPDTDKNGVTYLKTLTRQLEVSSFTFPQLLDYLQYVKEKCEKDENESVIILVEAGWLNRSHWYVKQGDKILDTHGGSFSHAIACHDLKFDLTAIELDKDYYEQAKQRLETHQRQLTLF